MSRYAAVRPVAVAVLAGALAVGGLSACTSKKTPAAGGSAAGSPSAAGSSANAAALALLADAKAALAKAKSVHLKGNIAQGGQTISLDISYVNGVGATGSIGLGSAMFKMIDVDKTLYIQGDANAFASLTGGATSGPAAALAGKWIKVGSTASSGSPSAGTAPGAGPLGDFSSLADLSQFANQFAPDGSVSEVPGKKTIDGKSAIGLLDGGSNPSEGAVLYVEADGDHRPLQVVSAPSVASAAGSGGPTTGELDFLDYDANVSISAPAGAVDMSQLATLFSGGKSNG